jgi:hypothetical protein
VYDGLTRLKYKFWDCKIWSFFSCINLGISDFRDLMKIQVPFWHKGIFVRPLHI